jgi:hypothetical protein
MAGILKDLNLVGSTTGLTIKAIRDRYDNYSLEGGFCLGYKVGSGWPFHSWFQGYFLVPS